MYHRKSKHLNTVAYCKNYLEGKCQYSDDMCWWNHSEKRNYENECYLCNQNFRSKGEMMKHRKKNHSNIVRDCIKYAINSCSFQEDFCWFRHSDNDDNNRSEDKNDDDDKNKSEEQSEQVFRKVSENLEPPLLNKKARGKTQN